MSNNSLDKFSNELLEKYRLNEIAELDDNYSKESWYKANKDISKNRVISDDEHDSVQSDEQINKLVKRLRLDVKRSDDDDEEYPDTQISAKKKTKIHNIKIFHSKIA
ncbi:hypothetical protein BpHYR1_052595 [Brachionus plicatilis]|uniref:Uncharacterized protein n=1 Tax=Brachionus plicatilis TaxID=10195 RepID=A0A3M7Q2B2_BRAPC|nr:hypothetical protein BpHYR1_052595 [Brachionus plicatilis]